MAEQIFVGGPTSLPKANGASPAGSDTVSTQVMNPGLADHLVGSVFCDQPGTLFIEQSGDGGLNWDISTSYTIAANDGKGFSEEIILAYARVRFQNTGASDATVLRLYAKTVSAGAR